MLMPYKVFVVCQIHHAIPEIHALLSHEIHPHFLRLGAPVKIIFPAKVSEDGIRLCQLHLTLNSDDHVTQKEDELKMREHLTVNVEWEIWEVQSQFVLLLVPAGLVPLGRRSNLQPLVLVILTSVGKQQPNGLSQLETQRCRMQKP